MNWNFIGKLVASIIVFCLLAFPGTLIIELFAPGLSFWQIVGIYFVLWLVFKLSDVFDEAIGLHDNS